MTTKTGNDAAGIAERAWEGCYADSQGYCIDGEKRVACVKCIEAQITQACTDIPTRMAALATKVLDRLRATDGFTTVGSMWDEDFAGDVAQLRQTIEDFNNE